MSATTAARELTGHVVMTVPDAGWAGMSNGALLARIAGHYEAFVTMDKICRHSRNWPV